MREDIPEDPPLNRKQAESVAKLTDADIEIIDDAIVSNITGQWRKVARVVMATMFDLDDKNYGVPELFYGQRVRALREKELFESQGDLKKIKYIEVRFTNNETSQKS